MSTLNRRRLAYVLLFLACASLAGLAAVRGWAEVLAFDSFEKMTDWGKSREFRETAIWESAARQLRIARQLNPGSAQFAIDEGRLYAWRGIDEARTELDRSSDLAEAVFRYREALVGRPSSAVAWILKAEALVQAGRAVPDGLQALERAMVFGPREDSSQLRIARIGAAFWPMLDREQKTKLRLILRETLDANPGAVIRLAVRYGIVDELAPHLLGEREQQILDRELNAARRMAR